MGTRRKAPREPVGQGDRPVAIAIAVSLDLAAVAFIGIFLAAVVFTILFVATPATASGLADWLDVTGSGSGARIGPIALVLAFFGLAQWMHYGLGWRGHRSSLGMRLNRVVMQHARGARRTPRTPRMRYLTVIVLPGVLALDLVIASFMWLIA